MGWVRVQVLMRSEHRKPGSVEAAAKVAAGLGLAPSGQGLATFSARVSARDYRRLFGNSPAAMKEKVPVDDGSLASADQAPLPVPKELAEYVESISIAPQHEYF